MRKTIYFSRRNKEVYDLISAVERKDISHEAVKLMEDGIKWRNQGKDVKEVVVHRNPMKEEVPKADLSGIRLERRAPSKGDLNKRLDNL